IYCAPYLYLFMTSLKTAGQLSDATSPLWPADAATVSYKGKDLTLYYVPIPNQSGGTETRSLALLQPSRDSATFIDPQNPDAAPITWQGRIRTLNKVYLPSWHPENYVAASQTADLPRLL